MRPASTSPMPALAMPALPLVLTNQWRSRAARTLPLPLSTTCAFRFSDNARAALTRSACTVVVLSARSRAASAGCGVTMVSARRRAQAEQGRAAHAASAAEDAERTGHPLVEVARPAPEHVAEELGRRHPRRRVLRQQAEIGDGDLAAMIGTVERQQAGFEADEGDGVRGAHGTSHYAPGVGIQSARDVEREHRAALAVRVVDRPRLVAGHVGRPADAEEPVDDESPGFVRRNLRLVDQ